MRDGQTAKAPAVQEISIEEAIKFLQQANTLSGKKWNRVATMLRDPDDVTRVLAVVIHEGTKPRA
jgi:hypothetical protein